MMFSDQKLREEKSVLYCDQCYEILFEVKGSYMIKVLLGLVSVSKVFCWFFLEKMQLVFGDIFFCNDIFKMICENIYNKNEV